MRILMFGWEFPPHISGGLGTACFGLTKGLSQIGNNEVIFVVPRSWGDEPVQNAELIGANLIPVAREWVDLSETSQHTAMIGIRSDIIPYMSPEQFWKLKNKHYDNSPHFVEVTNDGTIDFSGTYGSSLYREIRNYALVAEEIAVEKEFDVIHAHDWMTFPAGIAAKKVSGKPLVVHIHATDFDRTGGDAGTLVYSIERQGMELADKVITVSNLTRKTVVEKYGIPPEKVVTVYNAVEPLPERKNTMIKRVPGMKTVAFLGRITVQKGPEYFVEAAKMVLKRLPDARFVMAGSGDMMNDIIEHAARLGITDRFHFAGFLNNEEVHQLLDVSDVFVMPSVSEPFGIVPLEAMLAGVPVIISKQSGVAEIVNYAFKTDFWDTYAMADAIYGLLKYPALAKMFSKHGAIEAGNLQWKKSAGIISNIYFDLVGQSEPDYEAVNINV
jgi:glycosyltransferase involved in cell wall biosynthesis